MEFLSFAEAAGGSFVDDGLTARGEGAVFIGEQAAVLLGGEKAGEEGVHTDIARGFLGEIDGQPAGEVFNAGLGGRVCDDAGEGGGDGGGGEIDDRPATGFDHGRAEDKGREDGAMKVEIDDLLEGIEVEIEEGFFRRDGRAGHVSAGGVEDAINLAPFGEGGIAGLFERRAVEDIAQYAEHLGIRSLGRDTWRGRHPAFPGCAQDKRCVRLLRRGSRRQNQREPPWPR